MERVMIEIPTLWVIGFSPEFIKIPTLVLDSKPVHVQSNITPPFDAVFLLNRSLYDVTTRKVQERIKKEDEWKCDHCLFPNHPPTPAATTPIIYTATFL